MLKYKKGTKLSKTLTPINVLSFINPTNENKFYTPESDIVFQSIFGKPGNEKITKVFLQSILGSEVEDFTLNANPKFSSSNVKDKQQIADVKAICKESNNTILLDMQYRAHPCLTERFTTYAYRRYNEYLGNGNDYSSLKKVTLIVILAHNLSKFKNINSYHTMWNIREKEFSSFVFNEDVTIHLIELPKYIKQKKKNKKINPWLEFLIEPLGEGVEEAMRTEEELRKAVELLKILNSDEEVRTIAEAEVYAEMDRRSELNFVRQQGEKRGERRGERRGEKRGEKIGEKRAIEQIANNLLNKGMSTEDIIQITKIDEKLLKKIISKNNMNKCF